MTRRKYLISLVGLLFSLGLFQILTWDSLELKTEKLCDIYTYSFLFLYVSILFSIYYFLPQYRLREVLKAGGLIGIIILTLFLGIYLFPFGHNWNIKDDNQTLFVNKSDSRIKIIERVYRTGIMSDNEHYDTVVSKQLFKDIRWTKAVDISKIEPNEWVAAPTN